MFASEVKQIDQSERENRAWRNSSVNWELAGGCHVVFVVLAAMEDHLVSAFENWGTKSQEKARQKLLRLLSTEKTCFFYSPTGLEGSQCCEIAPFLFEAICGNAIDCILCLPCGTPSCITDEGSSLVVQESRYSSGDDRPRKWCSRNEGHSWRANQPGVWKMHCLTHTKLFFENWSKDKATVLQNGKSV